MPLKRITDPEQILTLWKAGLIVFSWGDPWARLREDSTSREVALEMLRRWPEHCNVHVEEEDDKGE